RPARRRRARPGRRRSAGDHWDRRAWTDLPHSGVLGLDRLAVAVLKLPAQSLQANVDQVADVRHGMAADPADRAVGNTVLKLEPDGLALAGRQPLEQVEHLRGGVVVLDGFERVRLGTEAAPDLLVAQLSHALLLPQNVERPVAADREEPLGQPRLDHRA